MRISLTPRPPRRSARRRGFEFLRRPAHLAERLVDGAFEARWWRNRLGAPLAFAHRLFLRHGQLLAFDGIVAEHDQPVRAIALISSLEFPGISTPLSPAAS